MPYGVTDALWNMLPPDDQEAVRIGWEASQQAPTDTPPAAAPPPEPQTIPAPGVALPDGGPPAVAQDSGPAAAPAGASGSGGLDFSGPARELAAFEQENLNDPAAADTRMPTQAWAATRDYMVTDQPFLGVHIRKQGQQLRQVVASDLWSAST